MKLRVILPLCLCLLGIFVLIGCIYIPIPEHPVDRKQKDFRPLLGTTQKPGAIQPGLTRDQVAAIIGLTPYVSPDQRTAVWFVDTEEGFWIGLGCAGVGSKYSYALVLRFNEQGKIISIEQGKQSGINYRIGPSPDWWEAKWTHENYLRDHVKEIPVYDPDTQPAPTAPDGYRGYVVDPSTQPIIRP